MHAQQTIRMSIATSALHEIKHKAEMLIKHKAKPSALLASRPRAKCFISCKARVRQCFNYSKEFPQHDT